MNGIIFNIQKFSVNDGPGIRTVVFFKGCPLRCKWCANPESQLVKVQVLHNQKQCLNCQRCAQVCPTQTISFMDGKFHIDHRTCTSCLKCIEACPNKALSSEGEEKSVEEIIDVVLQDEVFYEESGGGLTISGGEILAQPKFAIALLKEAHKHHLHTCCETTGYTNSETFQKVMEHVDYILMDLKHWNAETHKHGTMVSNALPIQNMSLAAKMQKEILPRIPVIPGFNDSLKDAEEFSKLLSQISIHQVQLLPFHQFGENKYDLLDEEYVYKDTPAYHREDLESYKQIFINNGIHAFF